MNEQTKQQIETAKIEGIIQGLKMAIELCADQGPAVRLLVRYEKKLKVLHGEIPEESDLYLYRPGETQSCSGRYKMSIPLSR